MQGQIREYIECVERSIDHQKHLREIEVLEEENGQMTQLAKVEESYIREEEIMVQSVPDE